MRISKPSHGAHDPFDHCLASTKRRKFAHTIFDGSLAPPEGLTGSSEQFARKERQGDGAKARDRKKRCHACCWAAQRTLHQGSESSQSIPPLSLLFAVVLVFPCGWDW